MPTVSFVDTKLGVTKKPAPHPGEILREDYLKPLQLSAYALARRMNVPRTRVERIADERIGVTADTALRLSRARSTIARSCSRCRSSQSCGVVPSALGRELATIEPIKRGRKK